MKKLIVVAISLPLFFGAIAVYRSWVQVRRLDLVYSGNMIAAGATARVDVVTSGRVPVDVRLELVQGARAETLAVQRVMTHQKPFWDMRTISSKMTVTLPGEVFARLKPGAALLRASARGRRQWLGEPAPVVKELAVVLVGG